jgi:hypothetical protein
MIPVLGFFSDRRSGATARVPEGHDLDIIPDDSIVDVIAGSAQEPSSNSACSGSLHRVAYRWVNFNSGEHLVELIRNSSRRIKTICRPPGCRYFYLSGSIAINSERGGPPVQ